MRKYRLANLGWENCVYPYFIEVAVCYPDSEKVKFWQQVSKNYFSEGWARRWARVHGIKLQN